MRIYYGWYIVAISIVALMLTIGSTMNSFGMYVIPASEDLGLTRANANTGLILINLGMAALAPVVGRMLDVYPIRRIMFVGAVMFGGSFILLGLSHNIWLSAFALAIPLPLGIAGIGHIAMTTVVAKWFEAQRGRAMALAMMGMSLGTVVMAPTIGYLIDAIGWRMCLIVLGSAFTVVFLVIVLFIREKPGPDDVEPGSARAHGVATAPAGPQAAGKPLAVMELLRMPIFWVLSLSVALSLSVLQTTVISIIPIAQEGGISVTKSATLLSVLGACSLAGKGLLAVIGDWIDRVLALALIFVFVALSSGALLLGNTYGILLFCAALQGLSAAAITPVFMALLADRIGAASFGTANGAAALIMSICGALAVRLGGEIYDSTGSYDAMFITFIVVSIAAAVLILVSKRLTGAQSASEPA